MKKIITFIIILLHSNYISSQTNLKKCNTTFLVNNEIDNNTDYAKARNLTLDIDLTKVRNTIKIPIVIHIIHRNSHSNIGSGTNISDAQIEDQLRILNEDYSKTNPEFPNPPRNTFLNNAGNPDIEFCLATVDPDGNTTTGITRTATSKINWDADDDDNSNPCHESNGMKRSSCGGKDSWDPKKYLNIWVCDLTNSQSNGMTLGYAYLPGLLANPFNTSDDYKDGLVVDYRYFGTIGVAAISSDGRTPTHEIGHYLGLMHTFCEEYDNQGNPVCCDNDNNNFGGYVDDTPATKDIYFGSVSANTNNNTCNDLSYSNIFTSNVLDMDENYMSYASNTWMFSNGQVDVMLATLNTSEINGGRSALKNSDVSTNCSNIISSSIDISSKNNVIMYPNPAKSHIYIQSGEQILSISLSNILGEIVIHKRDLENRTIEISNLKNGIYFLNIKTKSGHITKKLIKE